MAYCHSDLKKPVSHLSMEDMSVFNAFVSGSQPGQPYQDMLMNNVVAAHRLPPRHADE